MPQFAPGVSKTARVTMRNPTGKAFDYDGIVYMGTSLAVVSQASFHLEAGEEKQVSFPVVMPTTQGTYPVHIGVFSGGQSIGLYKAIEDVVIVSPPALPFTLSDFSVSSYPCPIAPAWAAITVRCTISNPNTQRVTHTLTLWWREYSTYYNRWYDPISLGSFALDLNPGESYPYLFDSKRDDTYYPLLEMRANHYFWLQDEVGNKSGEGVVYT
jgi:hypothetical protein